MKLPVTGKAKVEKLTVKSDMKEQVSKLHRKEVDKGNEPCN